MYIYIVILILTLEYFQNPFHIEDRFRSIVSYEYKKWRSNTWSTQRCSVLTFGFLRLVAGRQAGTSATLLPSCSPSRRATYTTLTSSSTSCVYIYVCVCVVCIYTWLCSVEEPQGNHYLTDRVVRFCRHTTSSEEEYGAHVLLNSSDSSA